MRCNSRLEKSHHDPNPGIVAIYALLLYDPDANQLKLGHNRNKHEGDVLLYQTRSSGIAVQKSWPF